MARPRRWIESRNVSRSVALWLTYVYQKRKAYFYVQDPNLSALLLPALSPNSDPSSHREKTIARRSRLLPHARPDPTSIRRGRHGSDRPDGGEVRLPFPTVRVRRTPPLRLPKPLGALLTSQLSSL
jgi:hypothetical protein